MQHHVLVLAIVKEMKIVEVDCVNQDHAVWLDNVPMENVVMIQYVRVNILIPLFR